MSILDIDNIIREYNFSDIQFCSLAGIARTSLFYWRNGRTISRYSVKKIRLLLMRLVRKERKYNHV